MGIKFKHIIKEQNDKVNRYIDFLLPKLKDYYENKYDGSDWITAASVFSNRKMMNTISESLSKIKSTSDEVTKLNKTLEKVNQMSPKEIGVIASELKKNIDLLTKQLFDVAHIDNLFREFIAEYHLNMSIIIPLMDRFYNEIYRPGKIEWLKDRDKDKVGVGHDEDLPEGANFLLTLDSDRGKGFYTIYKYDNRYIVRLSLDWDSDSGIYYVYADNRSEIMNVINYYELKSLYNSLQGALSRSEFNMDNVIELVKIMNRLKLDYLESLKERSVDADSVIYDVLTELGEDPYELGFDDYTSSDTFMTIYLRYRNLLKQIENKVNKL